MTAWGRESELGLLGFVARGGAPWGCLGTGGGHTLRANLQAMDDEAQARKRRAQQRRETWQVEPLSNSPPRAAESLDERLEQLEQLRRVGCALAGVPYPEGPTPKHVRRTWPMERIG